MVLLIDILGKVLGNIYLGSFGGQRLHTSMNGVVYGQQLDLKL